jgi:hypothetical protein
MDSPYPKQGSDWEAPALAKAKAIARKTVAELQHLHEQYPEDVPADVIDWVQQDALDTSLSQ